MGRQISSFLKLFNILLLLSAIVFMGFLFNSKTTEINKKFLEYCLAGEVLVDNNEKSNMVFDQVIWNTYIERPFLDQETHGREYPLVMFAVVTGWIENKSSIDYKEIILEITADIAGQGIYNKTLKLNENSPVFRLGNIFLNQKDYHGIKANDKNFFMISFIPTNSHLNNPFKINNIKLKVTDMK